MTINLSDLCITADKSVRQAMESIGRNRKGIVLIVDEGRRLIGTITDGDVRRAILDGKDLDTTVSELLKRKSNTPYPEAVTAPVGTQHAALIRLMQERFVRQVPLLDPDGRVTGLVTLDEVVPSQILPLRAVIMAGGFGTRLHPLTEDLPKPMLPVGGRPLMEVIINQLHQAGIRKISVATHYMSEKILNYFGDGSKYGVELNYVKEDSPLGTAGAIGLMEATQERQLIINGDILTCINFRALLAYHEEHEADLTVAVRKYDMNMPFGVIESDGVFVRGLVEKPVYSLFVNAGIYLMEPRVRNYIPKNQCFDMTELINCLLGAGRPVVSFPILEYWLDIGNHHDYEQSKKDFSEGKLKP
jgi:dTDP-glucose pyrophosphorylase